MLWLMWLCDRFPRHWKRRDFANFRRLRRAGYSQMEALEQVEVDREGRLRLLGYYGQMETLSGSQCRVIEGRLL